MEPASAVVGFAGLAVFGLDVLEKVDNILRSLDDTSNDLRDLRNRSADVTTQLLALQQSNASFEANTPQEEAYFQRLTERAQRCLDDVNAFADKVQEAIASQDAIVSARTVEGLLNQNGHQETLKRLKDLEIALGLMTAFVHP